MKKLLMYLLIGVGLLYTRALAKLFIKTDNQPSTEDNHSLWDSDTDLR